MATLGQYGGRRALLVTALCVIGDVGLWHGLGAERAAALSSTAGLVDLVAGGAAVALQGCLAWLSVVLALIALESHTGRRLTGYAGCPEALRRLLLGLCGLAMVGSLAAPAQATSRTEHRADGDESRAAVPARLLDGLAPPDREGDAVAQAPTGSGSAAHRVRPGDSLWTIARDRLPRGAGDSEITRYWHTIFETNRARLGTDPDLIHPETDLRLPDPHQEQR